MVKRMANRCVTLKPIPSFSPKKAFLFLLAHESLKENFGYAEQAIRETVRTNFPETWIWDLVSVE